MFYLYINEMTVKAHLTSLDFNALRHNISLFVVRNMSTNRTTSLALINYAIADKISMMNSKEGQ